MRLFLPSGAPVRHEDSWMARAIRERCAFQGEELVIERPDGSRRTVLAHAKPLVDETGKLFAAVDVLVDITDRQEAADAQEIAARARDEFLATLAHELRNPLAPIANAVQILLREPTLSTESRWALSVVDRQIRNMSRLVEDLMDVARVTTNRLDLIQERIEVADVLHAAVETSGPLIEARGHDLTIESAGAPIWLDGDATRLTQVVSNLLNNAAKYTERGGRILLKAEAVDGSMHVIVRDNGVGIPLETLPHVFDMFTQGHRSADRTSGLGIGLTLARRIVTLHGGTLVAQSEGPGKGAEFTVTLPVKPAPADAGESHPGARAPTPRLRVLVVDDNEDATASLGMLLEFRGNRVRTANDGVQAVEAAAEFRPDVILLDLGLPGIDGYEVARRIREQPWSKETLLVAVTGWGQDVDRRRTREAGFDHHLVKPIDHDALGRILASASSRGEAAPRNSSRSLRARGATRELGRSES
jgi:signal transduction histidine kinase/CheY-like chemotaxis protein